MKTIISKLFVVPFILILFTLSGCGDTQTAANEPQSAAALQADQNAKTTFAQTLVFTGIKKTYTIPKSGVLDVTDTFNGFFNGALGGLKIVQGKGVDILPAAFCTGTSKQIHKCLEKRNDLLALTPASVEVLINGQVVIAAGQIPRTQGVANVAVAVNSTNTVEVKLAGPKKAYIRLEITSENTPPLANPIADFSFDPTSGTVPLYVFFDASLSSSPNGAISSYAWDFGDGSSDVGTTAAHYYYSAGTFAVTLTVTDSAGKTATASSQIVVSVPQQPTASFTYSVDTTTGEIIVHTDGSSSSSPNGSIVDYMWDWGDGSANTSGSGATASHTFQVGTYTITLYVTDNLGFSSPTSINVAVP